MQPQTRETLERTLIEKRGESSNEFVSKIEKFLLTQETQYFFFKDETEFNTFIQLVGHDSFDFSTIRAWSYESQSTEALHRENEVADFEHKGDLHRILNYLGDIGTNLEFCNDFRIHVIVDLDAETSVFYKYQSIEDAHVCAECADLEEYDQLTGSSRFYSCEHEESTYNSQYYAVLRQYIPTEELDRALTFGEV